MLQTQLPMLFQETLKDLLALLGLKNLLNRINRQNMHKLQLTGLIIIIMATDCIFRGKTTQYMT